MARSGSGPESTIEAVRSAAAYHRRARILSGLDGLESLAIWANSMSSAQEGPGVAEGSCGVAGMLGPDGDCREVGGECSAGDDIGCSTTGWDDTG